MPPVARSGPRAPLGHAAWQKPCGSSELCGVILAAASADGQGGLGMVQLSLGQAEAARQDMAARFKGANRHAGTVGGTGAILRRLVISRRPGRARVPGTAPDTGRIAACRHAFGTPFRGFRVDFDAVLVDPAYPGAPGERRERLWLGGYRFRDDPAAGRMPGLPRLMLETVTVAPLAFLRAPAARGPRPALPPPPPRSPWRRPIRAGPGGCARNSIAAPTHAAARRPKGMRPRRARDEAAERRRERFLETIRN